MSNQIERTTIRLALPSKGRMEAETRHFLSDCGFTVKRVNPRQFIAKISEIPHLEVWFQRTADIVRKVRDGDVDFGMVGYDNVVEYQRDTNSIVTIHEKLGYGHCYLAVAVPEDWTKVNTLEDLITLAATRSETRPIRVVSKFQTQAAQFLSAHNIRHRLLYADGALEAGPQMGTADFIIDLVSSGVTLRENRLKEIEGGRILDSQMVLIGNRLAMTKRPEVLDMAHTMLERFEAHIRASEHHSVVANMRGNSPEDVAQKLFSQTDLVGLQGPTISPVYHREQTDINWYAISIVVRKDNLDASIRQIRAVGGSGVLVLPLTYIFDEEPPSWRKLLDNLGLGK
ncbi:ATP phosphoribosyltransferase [Anaerolineales bacterium HSG6]|nr:ATP phosphoribosyltransferase [Anaerolineales bacterium HSG6]MDM8531023.1 ATP phosphoribosyltransferase [Anaerolineales bacterium HSG25]